jgi:hypothetical protein
MDLAAKSRIETEETNADVRREMEAIARLCVNREDFNELKAIGENGEK